MSFVFNGLTLSDGSSGTAEAQSRCGEASVHSAQDTGETSLTRQVFCVGVREVFAELGRQAEETFYIDVYQVTYKGKLTIFPLLSPQSRRAHLEQNYF